MGAAAPWLASLGQLPRFPERTPWTAARVRAIVSAMKRGKAPGLDGWSVEELQALPDDLLLWISEYFTAVEDAGRWPAQQCRPEGVLLPKDGPEGADERRPIWLLPMLYRVWARGRSRDMAAWRRSWVTPDGRQLTMNG